jgi:hypothetical protein
MFDIDIMRYRSDNYAGMIMVKIKDLINDDEV